MEALEDGERVVAAGGGARDLDGGLRIEDHAQQAAHDRRVIDQENADFAQGGSGLSGLAHKSATPAMRSLSKRPASSKGLMRYSSAPASRAASM